MCGGYVGEKEKAWVSRVKIEFRWKGRRMMDALRF
jgi:hypothetical protein